MDDGVRENEMCPVFRATTDKQPHPEPAEVDSYRWVDWTTLLSGVADGSQPISPWCTDQLRELAVLGADPLGWPTGSTAELPPAALARNGDLRG